MNMLLGKWLLAPKQCAALIAVYELTLVADMHYDVHLELKFHVAVKSLLQSVK
jgi:hypothetical protein